MLIKKSKRLFVSMTALALTFLLCMSLIMGCGSPTSDQTSKPSEELQDSTTTVIDMVGRKVEVPSKVDRIIGIGSSSLRLISYLEAVNLVVGVELSEHETSVTKAYNHVYHNVFKDLPVIGDGGSKGVTSDEEAIINAAPHVIFASVDKDTADSLYERTGIPVVVLTLSNLVFDQVFYDNVSLVGSIIGKEDRAQAIIGYMKNIEQDLKTRTSSITGGNVKTAYAAGISFRGGHGFSGTEANFPPFETVNVKNIADGAGVEGAFDIDLEKVLSSQPDLIFIESGNITLVREDYNSNPDYYALLKAVQNGKVYSLIGYRYYAANIELAIANCYQVGAQAYPAQFSDIDPAKKLDEITEFFLGKKMYADLAAEGYSFKKLDITKL